MRIISRRQFLGRSATGIAAVGWLCGGAPKLGADPFGLPVGFQTYPIAQAFGQDLDGTLQQPAAIGYRSVEMCSPRGYAQNGFAPLIPMKASELRQHFTNAGMVCESSHYQFGELKGNLADRLAYSNELGLRQMIISSFGLPKDAKMDDWRRACEDANKIGAQTQKAGV
jgi:sugar phosphate isomerase/epimerase